MKPVALLASAALALASCGGDDDGTSTAATEPKTQAAEPVSSVIELVAPHSGSNAYRFDKKRLTAKAGLWRSGSPTWRSTTSTTCASRPARSAAIGRPTSAAPTRSAQVRRASHGSSPSPAPTGSCAASSVTTAAIPARRRAASWCPECGSWSSSTFRPHHRQRPRLASARTVGMWPSSARSTYPTTRSASHWWTELPKARCETDSRGLASGTRAPADIFRSAQKLAFHFPVHWPWQCARH